MGYPGVELTWKPGKDDNWVSYYEVFRDGAALDKVAKGTFYFDHSAGADLAARYEVRTVDGAGNVSARVAAKGPAAKARASLRRRGGWRDQVRRRMEAREQSAPRPRPHALGLESKGRQRRIEFQRQERARVQQARRELRQSGRQH